MAANWTGNWLGGRIATRRDGTRIWHLERMAGGVRIARALPSAAEPAALVELEKFLGDPAGYVAATRARAAEAQTTVGLDAPTIAGFLAHLKAQGRTLPYRKSVLHYLGQWSMRLDGRDLRSVSTGEIKGMLREWGSAEQHRVIAIKSLCSYLREELCVLPVGLDPTIAIKVPQPAPAKSLRVKGYAIAHVERIYACVDPQDVRDALCLRAKTGMHEREISRIATGQGVIAEVAGGGAIAATIRFVHKSGRIHVQSVDPQTLAAARRIAAAGKAIDNKRQHREIGKAAFVAEVPVVAPGELRHSFVTWARTVGTIARVAAGGLPLSQVAEAIGHASTKTTSFYYDGIEVPPMVVIPIRLHHPGDPATPSAPAPPARRAGATGDASAPAGPAASTGPGPASPRARAARPKRG